MEVVGVVKTCGRRGSFCFCSVSIFFGDQKKLAKVKPVVGASDYRQDGKDELVKDDSPTANFGIKSLR